jgi:hypothetical protein
MPPRKKKKTNIIASALPSLAHCPAYIGDSVSGPPAIFGTAFHKAVETGELKHALTKKAVEAAAEGQNYGKAEIEAAFVWSMDFIAQLEEKYKPAISKSEVEGSLEGRRFFIDHLMVVIPDSGPRSAIVIDWKTGRMVKDAQTDLQGLAYVREILGNDAYGIEQCAMMFVHPFVEKFSHAVFDREMLPKINEELEKVIQEAKLPNPPMRPGEGCKYCGKHPCPAVSGKIKEIADDAIDFDKARKDAEYMAELRDLVIPLEKFVMTVSRSPDTRQSSRQRRRESKSPVKSSDISSNRSRNLTQRKF